MCPFNPIKVCSYLYRIIVYSKCLPLFAIHVGSQRVKTGRANAGSAKHGPGFGCACDEDVKGASVYHWQRR